MSNAIFNAKWFTELQNTINCSQIEFIYPYRFLSREGAQPKLHFLLIPPTENIWFKVNINDVNIYN